MIAQVGPYPPPIGGISVYVRRMKDRLDDMGVRNEVWDLSAEPKSEPGVTRCGMRTVTWRHALRRDVRLVHYNIWGAHAVLYASWFNRTLSRGRPTVLTIHGDAARVFEGEPRRMARALSSYGVVICVRKGDRDYLIQRGVETTMVEIPAFAPPTPAEMDESGLPGAVRRFLDTHGPVLSANAWQIVFHEGADLYGLDLCVDLCAQLKAVHPRIGFVFCLPGGGSEAYLEEIGGRITAKGLRDDFLIVRERLSLCPIIRRSDLFLRPTNTDGDALSVREALYLKVPCLASDVAPRPQGTRLFRTRDAADLLSRALEMLGNPGRQREALSRIEVPDNLGRILDVYRGLGAID